MPGKLVAGWIQKKTNTQYLHISLSPYAPGYLCVFESSVTVSGVYKLGVCSPKAQNKEAYHG